MASLSHRIPARYQGIVMPLLLSLLMTFVVSLIATVRAVGFTKDTLGTWPGSWLLSWVIAFPTLLFVLPVVRRMVGWLIVRPEARSR